MIKSKGRYFGEYEIIIDKYSGKDFSQRCFVFPGQGVAYPGMAQEIYAQSKIIQDKFLEADNFAKKVGLQKISDYILNPDALDKRTVHIISNLALFTLECAFFEVLIFRKIIPRMLTGHSFGEYAAVVSSGMISFFDMLEIIYQRESLCLSPNSLGFMLAVGINKDRVVELFGGNEYYVSNLNSPDQTVISVSLGGMKKIRTILENEKIRYIVLTNVPQPYHSPYLNETRDEIAKYINSKKFTIKPISIPMFSSVLKRMVDENNFRADDIKTILINQITEPVDFIGQIESAYNFGCFNFLEIGPKKVFSGFIEDILIYKEIKTNIFADVAMFKEEEKAEKSGKNKKGGLFLMVSKIIGKITGYEIEKISFEDRFQEDLGIDSIKKADILLTILDESGIDPGGDFNTSQFKRVKDAVYFIENAGGINKCLKKKIERKSNDFRRFVLSWREKDLGKNIVFQDDEQMFFLFNIQEIFGENSDLLGRILRYLETPCTSKHSIIMVADSQAFDYDQALNFFKFFKTFFENVKITEFNVMLVSQGELSASIEGYASFLKSVKKEFPDMFFKYVHSADHISEKKLKEIVTQESKESFGEDVLYRNGRRFTGIMSLVPEKENDDYITNKTVIIDIGGAKGITFSLIANISQKYRPVIYLLGRSLETNEEVMCNLGALRKNNVEVFYESVDACNRGSLDSVFAKIKNKYGGIDLVINGAGVVSVGFLTKKTDENIEYEFRNKVLPALNVLELGTKYAAGKIINFSSFISRYGSAGQSIYTAANEMVNGFSRGRATVIHWPAWDGVGMTANKATLQKLREYDVPLMSPAEADNLFSLDINVPTPVAVYYMNESDDLYCSFALSDLQKYKLLLGEMEGAFNMVNTSMIFEKTFDLTSDSYLKDHKIENNAYVPAATGIAMFFCLAAIYFKKIPILIDVAIKNPIIVKDVPVVCRLEAVGDRGDEGDQLSLSLRSKVPCFSGIAQPDKNKKTLKRKIPKAKIEIQGNYLYSDYFLKSNFEYGKTFQCVEKIFFSGNGERFFRINNSKLISVLNLNFYDRLIQWMDVSFQAVGAVNLEKKDQINPIMIPVKITKLRFYPDVRISNFLYIIPEDLKLGKDSIQGNVVVVNEYEEVVAKFDGMLLKIVYSAE